MIYLIKKQKKISQIQSYLEMCGSSQADIIIVARDVVNHCAQFVICFKNNNDNHWLGGSLK